MRSAKRLCRLCKGPVVGRSDKIFCSLGCKNEYHVRLRQATTQAVRDADKILHRNRSILLEIVGKHKTQQKVHRSVLDKKKFNYKYLTGYYVNSRNKMYHLVYDFAWLEFLDGEILILRRKDYHHPKAKKTE